MGGRFRSTNRGAKLETKRNPAMVKSSAGFDVLPLLCRISLLDGSSSSVNGPDNRCYLRFYGIPSVISTCGLGGFKGFRRFGTQRAIPPMAKSTSCHSLGPRSFLNSRMISVVSQRRLHKRCSWVHMISVRGRRDVGSTPIVRHRSTITWTQLNGFTEMHICVYTSRHLIKT